MILNYSLAEESGFIDKDIHLCICAICIDHVINIQGLILCSAVFDMGLH